MSVKIGTQLETGRWKGKIKKVFKYIFIVGIWVNLFLFPSWVLDGYVSTQEENVLFGGERIILHGLGELIWFSFIGAVVVGSVGYWSLKKYKDPVELVRQNTVSTGDVILAEGEHFVRGTLMTNGPTPQHIAAVTQQAKTEGRKALVKAKKGDRPMPPVLVAGVPYPYKFENLGMYIQGSTGAGKSQVIKQMIYDIRRRGGRDRLIIYDRKPEYLPIFYREGDVIICPADRRHTKWDLFAEIKGEQDMDMVTQSLIPEAIGNANDKFWTDSARNVFRGILVYLFNRASETGQSVKNEDLCKFLFNYASAPDKMWRELSRDRAAAAFAQPIAGAGKTQSNLPTSVMATLTSYTQSFTRPEVAERGNFSVRDWLHDPSTEGSALFLLNPARYATNYQSYFTVILDILMREMISLPSDNDRRVWFFIDEFGSLFRLDSIKRLLAEGRSKGACIVIGTQDQAQIKDQYKDEGTQTIINNCNSKVLGRVSSAPEAEGLSKIIGEMEIERETESISSSYDNTGAKISINDRTNDSRRERRSVILPSELMNLPSLSYFLKFGDMNWMRSSIEYYPWNEHEIFPAFIPKPSTYFDTRRLIM